MTGGRVSKHDGVKHIVVSETTVYSLRVQSSRKWAKQE